MSGVNARRPMPLIELQEPNKIRHNYANMYRLPLIKKSLPSHPQGVGDTDLTVTVNRDPKI